jgi:hypothetical protein
MDAQSTGVVAVLSAQLQYEFFYSGPALSYVPINFRGLFDIQHGSPGFNRTEVEVVLSAYSQDFNRSQSVQVGVDCSHTCRYFSPPTASGLSSIQAPFTSSAAATSGSPSSATGSFSGVLMGGTDANGDGRGMVQLRALASAGGSSAQSWAFIDPSLTIAPSFLAAHPESSLTLPPGVGNAVTAVPELQSQALLLAGLAGLGVLATRRQRAGARSGGR